MAEMGHLLPWGVLVQRVRSRGRRGPGRNERRLPLMARFGRSLPQKSGPLWCAHRTLQAKRATSQSWQLRIFDPRRCMALRRGQAG